MSHWDGQAIIRWPSERFAEYPNWVRLDCGCCAGIEWGGEEPRECGRCHETGWIWFHEPSRRYALWPGGPFAGRALIGEQQP